MNPLAPAHHREEMERSHRRMNLLVRIAELRRIIPAAEREGKHDLAEACKSDIALHEERLDEMRWEAAHQLTLF